MQQDWTDLPVRWTKENSLHITLVFIGYASQEQMLEICRITKEAGKKHQSFEIKLNKILYGPPARHASQVAGVAGGPVHTPRMIWVEGEKSLALAKLKDDLENSLLQSNSSVFKREVRAFSPHITLARIRQWDWQKLEEQPKIEQDIDLVFPVQSIEVMESRLLRSGAEYIALESVALGE